MTNWLMVAVLGGVVGLDATSFPQVMVSRPLVAGALTGLLWGRPADGIMIGFIMEAFALIILPIGAARYPESGTATVAATAAYASATAPGMAVGPLVIVLAFGLAWEWLAGQSVMLQRRSNGRLLARDEGVPARILERRHLGAMSLDFLRGGLLTVAGALTARLLVGMLGSAWALPDPMTYGLLSVLVATMVGTTIALFGGPRARRWSVGLGLGAGAVLVLVL